MISTRDQAVAARASPPPARAGWGGGGGAPPAPEPFQRQASGVVMRDC
ncbi:hypothetical protein N9L76_06195 [bacterium]|nr:hypothetical protein [bacterium]